jgi:hypothetical protein
LIVTVKVRWSGQLTTGPRVRRALIAGS